MIERHRAAAQLLHDRDSSSPADLLQASREVWFEAEFLEKKAGFRNAQVTVLAPTGAIGFIMDCDTTGIEPMLGVVVFKKLVGVFVETCPLTKTSGRDVLFRPEPWWSSLPQLGLPRRFVIRWALATFATVSTNSFATDTNGAPALQAAVAYANTIVNSSDGTYATYPWRATLNTLADMLFACNNNPTGSTACTNLFAATTPPGGVAPVNTFQAILNIALNPSLDLSALYTAITPASPYQPILTSLPTSWIWPGSSAQITSLSANTGTTITINGSGFGSSQGTSLVVIDGVSASVISWSDGVIIASIPSTAGLGSVQVYVNGYGSNPLSFSPPVGGPSGLTVSLSLPGGPLKWEL